MGKIYCKLAAAALMLAAAGCAHWAPAPAPHEYTAETIYGTARSVTIMYRTPQERTSILRFLDSAQIHTDEAI